MFTPKVITFLCGYIFLSCSYVHLFSSADPVPAGISINTEVNFPDPNFRAAVEKFMGVTSGGAFTAEEAALKTGELNCSNQNNPVKIKSLQGIEFFSGITALNCAFNQLTSLDISKNIALQSLICNLNNLSSLDVSNNTALTVLQCAWNKLLSLDISKNTSLTEILFYSNQLSSLDVSMNTSLTRIMGDTNQIKVLDVSKNSALTELNCVGNQIKHWMYRKIYC